MNINSHHNEHVVIIFSFSFCFIFGSVHPQRCFKLPSYISWTFVAFAARFYCVSHRSGLTERRLSQLTASPADLLGAADDEARQRVPHLHTPAAHALFRFFGRVCVQTWENPLPPRPEIVFTDLTHTRGKKPLRLGKSRGRGAPITAAQRSPDIQIPCAKQGGDEQQKLRANFGGFFF